MLEQYYTINEAAGININVDSGGTVAIGACSVTIQKNQLNFVRKVTDLSSAEELPKHFNGKSFIAINLTGKGILQKQIEKTEIINQNNFHTILPNANIAEFYVQNFISGDRSFVAVIRKADADRWINQLTELGFVPLMLSLGPFPVQNIIPQLNVYGNELVFNGHTVLRNDRGEWISVNYNEAVASPFPFKVELENIHEKLIVAYAAAFQLVLAAKLEPVQAEVSLLETAFQKVVQEKKLKVHGLMLLSVFFVLLLINFFLFSWLNSANAKLTEQVSRSAQSTEDVQKVNEQIGQKEALLKNLGWENAVNKSVLIDHVASLLPADVTWSAAEIDPVDLSTSRTQKSIVFFDRRIRIVGNSEKIIPVNEWIARIKTERWIKDVQLESYTYNSELNTGQFIIVIDY